MKEAIGVASLADPAGQIRAVNDFYAQLDFELEQIAAVRLNAVRELRAAGLSYSRIVEPESTDAEGVSSIEVCEGRPRFGHPCVSPVSTHPTSQVL